MKVPSPGESVTEVQIANWLVKNGDIVEKDQVIAEIDSDKATLELAAEESGKIEILVQEGEVVKVGDVVCKIDTSFSPESSSTTSVSKTSSKPESEKQPEESQTITQQQSAQTEIKQKPVAKSTPLAEKMMLENKIDPSKVKGSGPNGKILKHDVIKYLSGGIDASNITQWGGSRETRREKMSMLRKKISERLVSVKNETAMLTTFNEVDMSAVIALRNKYKEAFKEKHGIGLGFMSLFTKAVCEALKMFPAVNAYIDGDEIVYHEYCDIGIAVSTPKGLMVPVIRNAEVKSLAEIEKEIKNLATKAREGKISIEEMTGGTFTITNGGVFGSMLSTPIINHPQSAILGMHNIVDRPVAVNGKVEIRPVMYVALSYDHRIIDGRESVSFLYKVKEMIENPVKMIFSGKEPEEILLNL